MGRLAANSGAVLLFACGAVAPFAGCGAGQAEGPEAATATSGAATSGAHSKTALPPATPVVVTAAARAVVDAPDRDGSDRALDAQRDPAELLSFAGIHPGLRLAELMAGVGYTTECLARAVTPGGIVYAQNNQFVLSRYAEKPWAARLAKPVLKDVVVRVDRELEDPLPADATNLDAIFAVLFYHDAVWMGADRGKMNRAAFAALKPGGEYVVVDHSAKPGHGLADVKTLHRIDEQTLADEVTSAGFRLVARADFLRHAEDPRDWNDSPLAAGERRGTSDRFVLKFIRP